MTNPPLTVSTFPHAILHIDGDAFFASCEQSRDPALRGRPVITGKERGIASSLSYEAKAAGVRRAMRLSDIKKLCPDVIMLPSDYETYSLLSQRFFSIVRRYTPDVEEYGIDECFADLTGLQRPFHMSYKKIADAISRDLTRELGFTFSVGLGPNKSIAKIASKWNKPHGLIVIPGRDIHRFIDRLPVEKVWGIGHQTMSLMHKFNIKTALDFARRDTEWVQKHFYKPHQEIWQELNGKFIFELNTTPKQSYQSIQKMRTFTPPSNDRQFVYSQLSKNIENACIKARRYCLAAKAIVIFLRTQDFRDRGYEIRFSKVTNFPNEILKVITSAFNELFDSRQQYRTTGAVLLGLETFDLKQLDLFGAALRLEKMTRLYAAVDELKQKYGKHTVYLGSSFLANTHDQHAGARGVVPARKNDLFRGENTRQRLAIPMWVTTPDTHSAYSTSPSQPRTDHLPLL